MFRSAPPVTSSAFESPARLFLAANAQNLQAQAARNAIISRGVQQQFDALQQAATTHRQTMRDAHDRATAEKIFGANEQQRAASNRLAGERMDVTREGQRGVQRRFDQERQDELDYANSQAAGLPPLPTDRPAGPPSGGLLPDTAGKVDPSSLHGDLMAKVSSSPLNGMVPKDGAQYGITTGSPEEWANLLTGLASVESDFRTGASGDMGRSDIPGGSHGVFQLSAEDAVNYGFQDSNFTREQLQNPDLNTSAAVDIFSRLVTQDGVISEGQRGAARYWGPLRRGVNPRKRFESLQIDASKAATAAEAARAQYERISRTAPKNSVGGDNIRRAEASYLVAARKAREAELAAELEEDRIKFEEKQEKERLEREADAERLRIAQAADRRAEERFDERHSIDPRHVTDTTFGNINNLIGTLDITTPDRDTGFIPRDQARLRLGAQAAQDAAFAEAVRRGLIGAGKQPTKELPGIFKDPEDDKLERAPRKPGPLDAALTPPAPTVAPAPATGELKTAADYLNDFYGDLPDAGQ